jgi:hypothetical protein
MQRRNVRRKSREEPGGDDLRAASVSEVGGCVTVERQHMRSERL